MSLLLPPPLPAFTSAPLTGVPEESEEKCRHPALLSHSPRLRWCDLPTYEWFLLKIRLVLGTCPHKEMTLMAFLKNTGLKISTSRVTSPQLPTVAATIHLHTYSYSLPNRPPSPLPSPVSVVCLMSSLWAVFKLINLCGWWVPLRGKAIDTQTQI